MQLINLYLLLLSISYNGQAYTSLTALFLFCTSVLLFGAFYTSFRHAVKMSVMMGYQAKSFLWNTSWNRAIRISENCRILCL